MIARRLNYWIFQEINNVIKAIDDTPNQSIGTDKSAQKQHQLKLLLFTFCINIGFELLLFINYRTNYGKYEPGIYILLNLLWFDLIWFALIALYTLSYKEYLLYLLLTVFWYCDHHFPFFSRSKKIMFFLNFWAWVI